uniref:Crossover junction endonuclease MUS81 n=1 Tax=Meloidogyne incognita TaxID=6306 RepID=A0A914LVL6_MELIC
MNTNNSNNNKRNNNKRRVKISLQFPEKLFYEKVLNEWRENISDRNHAYVVRKALNNLKLFPLDVRGHGELRKIRGIGEDIATRLDTAWQRACQVLFPGITPSINQIKELQPGQAFKFLEETASEANAFNKKRGNSLPFIHNKNSKNIKEKAKSSPIKRSPAKLFLTKNNSNNDDFCEPTTSTIMDKIEVSHSLSNNTNQLNQKENSDDENISEEHHQEQQLYYSPSENVESSIILISDNREEIIKGNRAKGKSVGEFLISGGIKWESRKLSVGDYLWILQWKDWQTGRLNEIVLDYIVERKTWDDLKKSIREPRYLEQKSRLQKCGINNIVLIVEGSTNVCDRSLEQAIISTCVDNDFLVHRTLNKQGTAKFLQFLTKRLEEKCCKEEIIGPSFETLQEKSKKPKPISISDCWLRQLTVCPGMSLEKAKLIQQRFPTFRSLIQFYKDEGKDINEEIPTLPESITKILNVFMKSALKNDEF